MVRQKKQSEIRITMKFKDPILSELAKWRDQQEKTRGSKVSWQGAINEILFKYLMEHKKKQ